MIAGALLELVTRTSRQPTMDGSEWLSSYNYAGDCGILSNWTHLMSMAERVGRSEDWAILVVAPLPDTHGAGSYVQCCGHAGRDLAVEVGYDPTLFGHLVAPAGAAGRPWREIGLAPSRTMIRGRLPRGRLAWCCRQRREPTSRPKPVRGVPTARSAHLR